MCLVLLNTFSIRCALGTSTAAKNGIPDRLFKSPGRWLSEDAKDGCVKEDLLERPMSHNRKAYKRL